MRKRWKAILIGIAAVALLWAGFVIVFRSIMNPEWEIQRQDVQRAYEQTVLTKTVKVDRFFGEKEYTVIQGEDKIGQPIIVFVNDEGIRTELAGSGITGVAAEAKVKAAKPGAEILRVQPGIMDGAVVWEVFYKLIPEGAKREQHFYDYYAFQDGRTIDTWRLTIQ